jgi:hypothetical protein
MSISKEKRQAIKKEAKYLEQKHCIRKTLEDVGYENMFRYMIEDLDHIEDISNTQSMYLFQLISALQNALEIYPRVSDA